MKFLESMLGQSILTDYYTLGMEASKLTRKYDISEQDVLAILMRDWDFFANEQS